MCSVLLVKNDEPMRLDDTCLVKLEGLDTLVDLAMVMVGIPVTVALDTLVDLAMVTVGIPVTVAVDTVVEPLILSDEFPCSDDELATRVRTNSRETSLLTISTEVEFCELMLVFKVLLVSTEVIEVCDIEGEVTKLELNSAELRAKLRVTLGVVNVPLLLVSLVAADVAFNKVPVVINNTDEDLVLDKTT